MTPRKPTDDWLDDALGYASPWIAGAFLLSTFILIPVGLSGDINGSVSSQRGMADHQFGLADAMAS